MKKLKIRPFDDAPLGAEVVGDIQDLTFDDVAIDTIKQALADHHALVLHGEVRADEQILAFGNRMGEASGTPGMQRDLLIPVGHIEEHPSPVLKNNDFEWHTDQACFKGVRGKETVLHGEVIPTIGGNTYIVSTYEVYEGLPSSLKSRLEGVRVLVDQTPYTAGFHDPEAARTVNPLVAAHPESGRRALYFQPYATIGVLDLPADEAADLLIELTAAVLEAGRVYKHDWTAGDVLLFDTWGTWHRRDAWDASQPRVLKMMQTSVEVPVFPMPSDALRADPGDLSMLRFGRTDTDADPREAALAWMRARGDLWRAAAA